MATTVERLMALWKHLNENKLAYFIIIGIMIVAWIIWCKPEPADVAEIIKLVLSLSVAAASVLFAMAKKGKGGGPDT